MGSRLFGEKLPPGFLWQDGYELHTNERAEYSLGKEEFGVDFLIFIRSPSSQGEKGFLSLFSLD